jgi:flavin-dependent dehydrogenase
VTRASEYDAVIVGARVAGASLALLLAREGRRVVVIDRDHFPSDTLSTHFMGPLAVESLRRLGVLDDVLAAGFRRIVRHRVSVGECTFEAPAGGGNAFSLSPRRSVIDTILVDRAREAGAEVLLGTRAERLVEDQGAVAGVEVTASGGDSRELRGRVVVGADGKHSKVAAWVKAEKYEHVPALRPAYYGYFRGVAPLNETALELFFGDDRIGFVFPMRPDEDCLALELQPEEFERFRRDPKGAFLERFNALPGMARRLASAELEGSMQGTRGVENYLRVPYGPGWALTGDAGYLRDPSTGLGMGDALAQSFLLAEALGAWFDGGDWSAAMAGFQEARDRLLLPLYRATLEFTRMSDPPRERIALLQTLFSMPSMTRTLAYALPDRLPDLLPAPMVAQLETMAARVATRSETGT